MIRLAHFADVHLGTSRHGPSTSEGTAVHPRLRDQIGTWHRSCKAAVELGARIACFCGDAFRTASPTPTEELGLRQGFDILRAADIQTFMIAGNHDLGGVGEATALCNLEDDNVTLLRGGQVCLVQDDDGLSVCQILPVPYFTRHYILAQAPRLSKEETSAFAARYAEAYIQGLLAQCDPNVPVVAMVHHDIQGSRVGNGFETSSAADPFVPITALDTERITYTAAGHIHLRQSFGSRSLIHYCGSQENLDFGEEGQEKSWTLVDLERGRDPILTAVPTNPRRFLTLDLDFTAEAAPGELTPLRRFLEATPIAGAVVRVRYELRRDQAPAIRHEEMRALLAAANAWHLHALVPEFTDAGQVVRIEGLTSTAVHPRTALEHYLAAKPDLNPAELLPRFDAILEEALRERTAA